MASETARRLRRDGTEAERRLWAARRDGRSVGYKYRRQRPIGPCVADFFSIRQRLIIEVDGGQHLDGASDARRTAWLERHGWRVIRFWNNDISTHSNGVAEYILNVLQSWPALNPPIAVAMGPSLSRKPASGRGVLSIAPSGEM